VDHHIVTLVDFYYRFFVEALPAVLRDREDRDVTVSLHGLRYYTTLSVADDVAGWAEETVYWTLTAILLDEPYCSEPCTTGLNDVTNCCFTDSH
jgi:hypothetical protein